MCMKKKNKAVTMLKFDDIKDIDDLNKLRDYFLEPLEPIIQSVKEMPQIIDTLRQKIIDITTERRACYDAHMRDNVYLNKEIELLKTKVSEMEETKVNAPKILYDRIMKTISLILGIGAVFGVLAGLIGVIIWAVLQLQKIGLIK